VPARPRGLHDGGRFLDSRGAYLFRRGLDLGGNRGTGFCRRGLDDGQRRRVVGGGDGGALGAAAGGGRGGGRPEAQGGVAAGAGQTRGTHEAVLGPETFVCVEVASRIRTVGVYAGAEGIARRKCNPSLRRVCVSKVGGKSGSVLAVGNASMNSYPR